MDHRALLDSLADATIVVGHDGVLHYANHAAERLMGHPASERLGTSCFELLHPDDHEMALVAMISVAEERIGTPIELRVKSPTGWRVIEFVGAAIDVPGIGPAVLSSLRDITDRRRWEVAAGDDARFRALLQNGVHFLLVLDEQGIVTTASAALTRSLGHDQARVLGAPFITVVADGDRAGFETGFRTSLGQPSSGGGEEVRLEVLLRTRTGDPIPYQLTLLNLLDDPSVDGIILTGHDVTDLRAAREELERIAFIDHLTGLPNRAELVRELARRLDPRREPTGSPLTVAFVDLNGFKAVNDGHGHAVGDELLIAVAERLRRAVRPDDLVARFGGDEFVVVAEPAGTDPASELCERLERTIARPFALSIGPVTIGSSAGAVVADPGDQAEEVIAAADDLMYHRKQSTTIRY